MDYQMFLETKRHNTIDHGIETTFIPDGMFDFQEFVARRTIKKGRYGVFLDTGLGKTLIELTVAVNYLRHTNKPVLIITPLAVAFQLAKIMLVFLMQYLKMTDTVHFLKFIQTLDYMESGLSLIH